MSRLPEFEGPYQLQAERSRGPIVTAYQAVSAEHGSVVVRLLNPRLAVQPALCEQFRRAADLLSELDHPNLGTILDGGTSRGTPFYVTPDYPETLRERLGRGALGQADAIRIGREVAEGLAHAHPHGFIHRDVRPETIFFDRQGRAVLCEFGLEIDPDRSARTMVGTFLGAPAYMAPEQLAGLSKLATDAYSLGIVLFEMLTGRPPFQDPDPIKLCNLHAFQPAPRLDTFLPGAPEGLVRLIACLLEKEPEKRVAGMGEVVETLAAIEAAGGSARGPASSRPADGDETIVTPPSPGRPVRPVAVPPVTPKLHATPPPPPPPAPPPAPPTPARDPTWLRAESGNETRFFSPRELRGISRSRRSGVPFWVWVLAAVILTIAATLLLLRPWERPEGAEPRLPSKEPVGMRTEPAPAAKEEEAPDAEETDAQQPAVGEATMQPPPPEPEAERPEPAGETSPPPPPQATTRQRSPPPAEYDWTAAPATLLVSATTEEDRHVAASIHVDGRALGEQTTKEVTLGPGVRRIRVVRTGMRPVRALLDGKEIPLQDGEAEIHLEPGKIARLRFVLSRS